MIVDIHCHIGQRARPCQPRDRFSFEPAETYAPFDAYVSDRLYRGIGGMLIRRFFGIRREWSAEQADAFIEAKLLEQLLGTKRVDRAVVLAFDQYHRQDGACVGRKKLGERLGTDLYVSNTYVHQLCRNHPDKLLFGASIHPYRMSAGEMLEEVAQAGAVLIKWLPPAQNIDAEDSRTVAFLRKAAELAMPMLIHYGGEMTLGNAHPEFMDPSGLLRTLRRLRTEGVMPTVIVAHAATPSAWPFGSGRYFELMVEALQGEFADAPLYVDISALAVFARAHWLKCLLRTPEIHRKLVQGSDFPIPPTAAWFLPRLGRKYRRIAAIKNWIDRDVEIKSALGLSEDVFTRGGRLLRPKTQPDA